MKGNKFPQPDFSRSEWLALNGTWDFSFDEPIYDNKINVPFSWDSPLSGILESKKGTGFYRRKVVWNPNQERIFLIFGAVDYICEVKVNGKYIGSHQGGYSRFEFDVTDIWDRNNQNTIEVKASDFADKSQTYGKQGYGGASGIWQTVWLEARPNSYITGFFVNTKIDGTVTYEVEAVNAESGRISFTGAAASCEIRDGKGILNFKVENPKLWTPETPDLYYGTLVLSLNGQEDRVDTYFGIREIGTGVFGKNNNRYITLNGKPYYINGALDQSFNPQGFFTLPTDEDCSKEIYRLKRLGINMVRIHVKAEEPLKLYYADKHGMLVMEDIPCFWGDPTPVAKERFEIEMREQIIRDRNHPSVFSWIVFNETWGLFHHRIGADGVETKEYTDETAEWVLHCYKSVKKMDDTRLVEDNSPCHKDHTVTDINTWHFYANGYLDVKKRISDFTQNAYVGSQANYREGFTMTDVPCMNSECGNVWGVDGNSGESDISWQYHYMMNEFRLHDNLCGFVFTEFHDVPNEFNGYYKINNEDKDFGYSLYGASLRDMHVQDFIGADYPPMKSVKPKEKVSIPMFVSSFSDQRHGKSLRLEFSLVMQDPLHTDQIVRKWDENIQINDYGCTMLSEVSLEVPDRDGIAELRWSLFDEEEKVMSNFLLFDICSARKDLLSLEPVHFKSEGFTRVISAISDSKVSGIGKGEFSFSVKASDIPNYNVLSDISLVFEASTREPMSHDFPNVEFHDAIDLQFMLGYKCDPGANKNSFKQTDETKYPGKISILLNGTKFAEAFLPDCPSDSRGSLSHHYQPRNRRLDEAGSYGTLIRARIPSNLLLTGETDQELVFTIRADEDSGVSLYGRHSGRYGIGVVLIAE